MLVLEMVKTVNKPNLVVYASLVVLLFVSVWNTIEVRQLSNKLRNDERKVNQELLELRMPPADTKELKMTPISFYKDCSDVKSHTSGVFEIERDGNAFSVYCNFDTPNEKWTVIQRRVDTSVNFIRDFNEYKQGFGELQGNFWLGLENIHQLTKNNDYELLVRMTGFDNAIRIIRYATFSVTSAENGYRLFVDGYDGKAGDALSEVIGQKFSTFDKRTETTERYCSSNNQGGWWYDNCSRVNPNGVYGKEFEFLKGIMWHNWGGMWLIYKDINMMIRKKPTINKPKFFPRIGK